MLLATPGCAYLRVIMPRMRTRFSPLYLLAIPVIALVVLVVYNIPFVHERLAWRVDNFITQVKYAINPPSEMIFVPQEQAQIEQIVQATLDSARASATPILEATLTATLPPTATNPGPSATPSPTSTPTLTPTPLPASVRLSGITHVYQKWNNCGPANLAMILSFWGWRGTQTDTADVLKPNDRDKNVMPYEMADFVNEHTDLRAVVRVAGELELLKQLLAAGFPVLIEKGFEGDGFDGWMGHYEVVNGFDDARGGFWVYDSYIGPSSDFIIPYDEILSNWQAFNYIYLVIYPPEREAEVSTILGPQWDETTNWQLAAQRASDEIYTFSGRQQYFAWFNRGSSLVKLFDYAGAAAAYDEAYAMLPSMPEDERPWRMMWYQTGPYFAYQYSERYYDVINLATITISAIDEPALEESFYWRAMANLALGATESAVDDLFTSLRWHPGFEPSVAKLQELGYAP